MPLRSAVILVAILAMFASPSFAQSLTGGVKAGVNFSKIAFGGDEGDADLERKPGLVVGAFLNVPMTEIFSFHPEFLDPWEVAKKTARRRRHQIEAGLPPVSVAL